MTPTGSILPRAAITASLHTENLWGLILAGGEGVRLRPLTRAIGSDDRPKQFCAVFGSDTLLERTKRRAALAIPASRTLVALTERHEPYYRSLIAGMPPHSALVQPEDRGTAAAILYGLLRIATMAPLAAVAILPSDHYVSDEGAFMRHVATAFAAVQTRPELVVLLGMVPDSAETEYGWIEPAAPIPGTALFRVRQFCEKPTPVVAEFLLQRRCLWNSFVMIGAVPALLAMTRHAAPVLTAAFSTARGALGGPAERAAVQAVYGGLCPSSFAANVLAARPANLAVLPVTDVQWSDWGQPARVLSTLAGLGIRPEWADRLEATG